MKKKDVKKNWQLITKTGWRSYSLPASENHPASECFWICAPTDPEHGCMDFLIPCDMWRKMCNFYSTKAKTFWEGDGDLGKNWFDNGFDDGDWSFHLGMWEDKRHDTVTIRHGKCSIRVIIERNDFEQMVAYTKSIYGQED